ncbi:MAG: hypothetical protein GYA23_11675 [Methanomicrobiales archaeon]|nr:hypothetical protein [Methanomicrobiales archaeon]
MKFAQISQFLIRYLRTLSFKRYLHNNSRIRARITFEVDREPGFGEGVWLYYDNWPEEWKAELLEYFHAYAQGTPLPAHDPLPLAPYVPGSSLVDRLEYRCNHLARLTYFAQVAHCLYLDIYQKVPWKLTDWSDDELRYLLSSMVCFRAHRETTSDPLRYVVFISSRQEATENILSDPRIAVRFLQHEPEEGRCLLGTTPEETCQLLSGWIHDYLHHNPGPDQFDCYVFYRNNPLLEDRLRRHPVPPYGNLYVTPLGCGSASSLFMDLMRSVNIPIRKVNNLIVGFDNNEESHSGLLFNWQGAASRYLLHTDDLYTTLYFQDPAPAPKGTDRGVALWNHVWLDPTAFGKAFSYIAAPSAGQGLPPFGRAECDQKVRFWETNDWLVVSAQRVAGTRNGNHDYAVASLKSDYGLSDAEAEACWNAVIESVTSYGDGDLNLGYQRLLDGPDSRHQQWCNRTGKCY